MALTWQLKRLAEPPRVVIYSAFAGPRLAIAATISGADAMLDKSRPPDAIFRTVRDVAAGAARVGMPSVQAVRDLARFVVPQDQSIFGLALAGEAPADIAAVLRMDERAVRRRLELMLDSLAPGREGYGVQASAG